MRRECETCIKKKTLYCPNSIECMATDNMPYYQNRIMILEENERLKRQFKEYKDNYKEELEENNKLSELWCDSRAMIIALKNQQKEFINWLKSMIKIYEEEYKDVNVSEHYNCVLSKYKEIIGGENE